MTRTRSVCLGGAFNPIHHGHLLASRAAAERLGYQAIELIPSALPPLKVAAADMASAADRLRMCRLAIENVPQFEVNDLELRRQGPSYTLTTARELKAMGRQSVDWLIGADAILELPRWHGFPGLLEEVNFIVMARPGWSVDWSALSEPLRRLESKVVELPPNQISATDIRERVSLGLSIDYLTPPAVCRYIREHGLYRRPSQG